MYKDSLPSGWYDLSWSATVSYSNSKPVASGSKSISFIATAGWAGLQICSPGNFNTSGYTHLQFSMQASQAGQQYGIYLRDSNWANLNGALSLANYGGAPSTSGWTTYTVPLADLKATNLTISNIVIQSLSGSSQTAVYVDDVKFVQM